MTITGLDAQRAALLAKLQNVPNAQKWANNYPFQYFEKEITDAFITEIAKGIINEPQQRTFLSNQLQELGLSVENANRWANGYPFGGRLMYRKTIIEIAKTMLQLKAPDDSPSETSRISNGLNQIEIGALSRRLQNITAQFQNISSEAVTQTPIVSNQIQNKGVDNRKNKVSPVLIGGLEKKKQKLDNLSADLYSKISLRDFSQRMTLFEQLKELKVPDTQARKLADEYRFSSQTLSVQKAKQIAFDLVAEVQKTNDLSTQRQESLFNQELNIGNVQRQPFLEDELLSDEEISKIFSDISNAEDCKKDEDNFLTAIKKIL